MLQTRPQCEHDSHRATRTVLAENTPRRRRRRACFRVSYRLIKLWVENRNSWSLFVHCNRATFQCNSANLDRSHLRQIINKQLLNQRSLIKPKSTPEVFTQSSSLTLLTGLFGTVCCSTSRASPSSCVHSSICLSALSSFGILVSGLLQRSIVLARFLLSSEHHV
jgi:hypothetical protein